MNPFQRFLHFVLLCVNEKLNKKKKISISFVSVLTARLLSFLNHPFGTLKREFRGNGFEKFFSESLVIFDSLFFFTDGSHWNFSFSNTPFPLKQIKVHGGFRSSTPVVVFSGESDIWISNMGNCFFSLFFLLGSFVLFQFSGELDLEVELASEKWWPVLVVVVVDVYLLRRVIVENWVRLSLVLRDCLQVLLQRDCLKLRL